MNRTDIDADLVRGLLSAQFPEWAELPVSPVDSAGVDNAIFRLGTDMCVRMPCSEWSAGHVRKEQRWLPGHARRLPAKIPTPLGRGVPGAGFPWHWSVYQWLHGTDAITGHTADEHRTARDMAAFVRALQRIPTGDGPRAGLHSGLRGVPLPVREVAVRPSIDNLRGVIDTDRATAAWESAMRVPPWRGNPVWVHSDLHPGNILVRDGRVDAVIDWGLLNVGDPAVDLMVAWTYLTPAARETFRAELAVDDDTWARGRGWALCVGLIALAYYMRTNPVLGDLSRHAIDETLADFELAAV